MMPRYDLELVASQLAETIGQQGVGVDHDALTDALRWLDTRSIEQLATATDPGGLLDTIDAIAPEVLIWDAG